MCIFFFYGEFVSMFERKMCREIELEFYFLLLLDFLFLFDEFFIFGLVFGVKRNLKIL